MHVFKWPTNFFLELSVFSFSHYEIRVQARGGGGLGLLNGALVNVTVRVTPPQVAHRPCPVMAYPRTTPQEARTPVPFHCLRHVVPLYVCRGHNHLEALQTRGASQSAVRRRALTCRPTAPPDRHSPATHAARAHARRAARNAGEEEERSASRSPSMCTRWRVLATPTNGHIAQCTVHSFAGGRASAGYPASTSCARTAVQPLPPPQTEKTDERKG